MPSEGVLIRRSTVRATCSLLQTMIRQKRHVDSVNIVVKIDLDTLNRTICFLILTCLANCATFAGDKERERPGRRGVEELELEIGRRFAAERSAICYVGKRNSGELR